MRILTVLLVLAAWWQTSLSQASVADGSRPNFIIIFIDDLGYADIGPFGATRQRTPHLDRMAREVAAIEKIDRDAAVGILTKSLQKAA